MSRTNTRLQRVIDELNGANVIADIGTDHGYLPIMAVEQNKTKKAYASDINSQPLSSAMKNVEGANYSEFIKVLQSDGLTYYKQNKVHLDYAIIAGLGSKTIKEIMAKDYKGIDNYLICSNTEPSAILKIAKRKRLRLIKEDYFVDKGRWYWLINLCRADGMKIKTFKDIYVGIDQVLTNKDYLKMLARKYEENKTFLDHLKRWSKRYRFLTKLNKNIKEVLDNGTSKNN